MSGSALIPVPVALSRCCAPVAAVQTFDSAAHWKLLKEMLSHMFATPKRHHKSKPFFDHVISFSVVDGRIWLRNYQVTAASQGRCLAVRP